MVWSQNPVYRNKDWAMQLQPASILEKGKIFTICFEYTEISFSFKVSRRL